MNRTYPQELLCYVPTMTHLPCVPAEGAGVYESSLDLTDDASAHVSFHCDGKTVSFQFFYFNEKVGDRINISRADAFTLGENAEKTGTSDLFPISGLSVDAVKNFGRRLWLYGKDGK